MHQEEHVSLLKNPKIRTFVFIPLGILLVLGAFAVYAVKLAKTPDQTAEYPICAETESGANPTLANPSVELPLNPRCWSGWVTLPVHANFRVSNGDGDLEYFFLDGTKLFVSGKEKKWLGRIRSDVFRLRGDGIATISIEPKS